MSHSTVELSSPVLLAGSTWIEHKHNPVCQPSFHHMTMFVPRNIASGPLGRSFLLFWKSILTEGAFRYIPGHSKRVLRLVLLLSPFSWPQPPETRQQLIFVTIIMIIVTIRKSFFHRVQLLTNGPRNVKSINCHQSRGNLVKWIYMICQRLFWWKLAKLSASQGRLKNANKENNIQKKKNKLAKLGRHALHRVRSVWKSLG